MSMPLDRQQVPTDRQPAFEIQSKQTLLGVESHLL